MSLPQSLCQMRNIIFEQLYGKVATTEEFCPSLKNKSTDRPKVTKGYKYLASRVVAKLDCSLCGKPRCVFSMTGLLTTQGQREIEDIIFSCGMSLKTNSLYTARHLKCPAPIENAYHGSKISNKKMNSYFTPTENKKQIENKTKTILINGDEGIDEVMSIDFNANPGPSKPEDSASNGKKRQNTLNFCLKVQQQRVLADAGRTSEEETKCHICSDQYAVIYMQ